MKDWIVSLWTDPTKFAVTLRTLLMAVAAGLASGQIPPFAGSWIVTLVAPVIAVAIPAGQKNEAK